MTPLTATASSHTARRLLNLSDPKSASSSIEELLPRLFGATHDSPAIFECAKRLALASPGSHRLFDAISEVLGSDAAAHFESSARSVTVLQLALRSASPAVRESLEAKLLALHCTAEFPHRAGDISGLLAQVRIDRGERTPLTEFERCMASGSPQEIGVALRALRQDLLIHGVQADDTDYIFTELTRLLPAMIPILGQERGKIEGDFLIGTAASVFEPMAENETVRPQLCDFLLKRFAILARESGNDPRHLPAQALLALRVELPQEFDRELKARAREYTEYGKLDIQVAVALSITLGQRQILSP